jgi:hypothetical protein
MPEPTMTVVPPSRQAGPARAARRLSPRTRRAVLTAHIVLSVGLLGEVCAFLAIAVRSSGSDDAAFAATGYDLLASLQLLFGIPLSFLALATGLTLGLGTKWGVLRYPWVTIKLALIISVILMGALVLGPAVEAARAGDDDVEPRILAGAAWDVVALVVATTLGVYKPGGPRQWRRRGRLAAVDGR